MTILHTVTCYYALRGLTSDDLNCKLNEDEQVKLSMPETICGGGVVPGASAGEEWFSPASPAPSR